MNGTLVETTAALTTVSGISRTLRGTTVHIVVVARNAFGAVLAAGRLDYAWAF